MADISVRGYVNKPQAKTAGSSGKKFSTFTLAEQVKDREGNKSTVFYNVTDFDNEAPPAESSYGTVEGWLKVRAYEKDGQKRQSLDIIAKKLDFQAPRGKAESTPSETPAAEKEPWEE